MQKQVLSSLLFTVAFLIVAAGIVLFPKGGVKFAAENEVKLRVWQGFKFEEVTVMEEIADRFKEEWEAKNPGKVLDIEIERVSYDDMVTKLKTAALASQTPDVAFVDALKVPDLAFGQTLQPIDELENFRYKSIDEARQQFVTASFDMGVVNRLGKENLYGIPVQTTTLAMFWNRKIFRDSADKLRSAGLDPNRAPRDWDELIEYARALEDKEKGIYGYAMSGSLWFQFPIYNQYNVNWVRYEKNGRAVPDIDNPRGKAALQRIADLYLKDKVEAGAWKRGAMGPDQGFLNEKYAMILMGPWFVEKFESAGLDFDVSLVPAVPADEAAELGIPAQSSSNIGGQIGVIFESCEEPELAYDFIEYFTSEKEQRYWSETLGQIPVRQAAWENLNTEKFPYVPKFMEQLKYAKRLPQMPLYGTLENEIANPEFDLLMNDKITVQEALEHMEKSLDDKVLKKLNARFDSDDSDE
ncbi:extracellular solute-binding protein [bacterium]|nr:extracellular solute-binding protein [bacterium]